MADWKQITARIRRARTGKDPAGQLSNLFSKTRDAMVAFELARYFESTGNSTDAGKWYLTAAQRFRRSDWKTKAQESATRLGATEAAEVPAGTATEAAGESTAAGESAGAEAQESAAALEEMAVVSGAEEAPNASKAVEAGPAQRSTDKKHRRGRRGGREHRPARRSSEQSSSSSSTTSGAREPRATESSSVARTREAKEDEAPPRPVPSRSFEQGPEVPAPSLRGRYGDPGLASRLTQLEMNFRRLLTCEPIKLEDATGAPAGPGVWVLTDSDLTTYYYVEACQTLRVAIPNLLRSGSVRRGESIKPQLADHLGIPETRVAKYLSDHCVVRWLQMDDGAAHFAHFLVAVLHPTLNE
ncbi:MAG TPA: hypothetical protein VGF19_09485 [Candidatus Acidoferrum sp.]